MSLLSDNNKINLDKVEKDIKEKVNNMEKMIKNKEPSNVESKDIEPTNIIKKRNIPTLIKNDTLVDFEVSNFLGDEYIPLLNDLSRMITLQVIIQLMLSIRDPEEYPFFSQHFFELLFYIILGLMTYWLVIKKIFKLI
jgi:hypothetical protein|tara:strand:+ start:538 stop:951 length:414 start_codon:yes stop_codon:yes gene_type:complete